MGTKTLRLLLRVEIVVDDDADAREVADAILSVSPAFLRNATITRASFIPSTSEDLQ